MKTIFSILLGLSYISILVLEADAFNFQFFAMNRTSIPEDILMVLLAAGIIGLIGMTRRKIRK